MERPRMDVLGTLQLQLPSNFIMIFDEAQYLHNVLESDYCRTRVISNRPHIVDGRIEDPRSFYTFMTRYV